MTVMTASGQRERQHRKQYFGKYRGTVLQNADPKGIGRLQVQVAGVFTVASSWAMPSFPVAGPQTGAIAVPPIGAGVWVEFEAGDPDDPIWTGCYYSTRAEVPPTVQLIPPPLPAMTMQTPLQNMIQLSDAVPAPVLTPPAPGTGGIVLRAGPTGPVIAVNSLGVHISDGKGGSISITGGTVTVNSGALMVK